MVPKKGVLIVLSEWGHWGEELIGPLETFDQSGYRVDFATPRVKRPTAPPPSMDPSYVDPPLGRSVTGEEVARKVKQLGGSDRGSDRWTRITKRSTRLNRRSRASTMRCSLRDFRDRRLPLHHRQVHARLLLDRREDGGSPRQGPDPLRLVNNMTSLHQAVGHRHPRRSAWLP